MEKIKDFHFYNLVLAAKHWYIRGENENIYDFVLRLVKLEDKYIVFDRKDHKGEAVRYCLMCLDELAKYYRSNGITKWWDNYCTMSSEIEKFVYFYGAEGHEEALIMFVFNILMMLEGKDIDLPKPIYGKGYPRLNNYNGFTYKHMRDVADKIFEK